MFCLSDIQPALSFGKIRWRCENSSFPWIVFKVLMMDFTAWRKWKQIPIRDRLFLAFLVGDCYLANRFLPDCGNSMVWQQHLHFITEIPGSHRSPHVYGWYTFTKFYGKCLALPIKEYPFPDSSSFCAGEFYRHVDEHYSCAWLPCPDGSSIPAAIGSVILFYTWPAGIEEINWP